VAILASSLFHNSLGRADSGDKAMSRAADFFVCFAMDIALRTCGVQKISWTLSIAMTLGGL
jgi:hypothetical protein